MAQAAKVFISYAHGDRDFQDRVLALADRMEILGLELVFDQYEPNPGQGWTKWMLDGVRNSDFVICLCTPAYHERVNEDQAEGTGLGAQWEGTALYNLLQNKPDERQKVQVVQLEKLDASVIPLPILGNNRFVLQEFDLADEQFEALYRVLTKQPKVERPSRGSIVDLPTHRASRPEGLETFPPKERTEVPRSGAEPAAVHMQMAAGSSESNGKGKRGGRPGRAPGQGDLLQRLARKKFQEAWAARDDDRLEDAVRLAQEAQGLDGSLLGAISIEARSYHELRQWAEAAEALGRYLGLSKVVTPEDEFRYHVAKLFAGDPGATTARIEEIVRQSPDNVEMKLCYSAFLEDSGDREVAKGVLFEAIERNRDPELMTQLAVIEWRDGNVAKATALLEEAVLLNSESPNVWANLGVGRAEMRRFGLGIEALRRALALRPRFQFAQYALAEIYALMGDAEAAVEPLRELVRNRYHFLSRLVTERTFDPIRSSEVFQAFLGSIPSELLKSPT